MAAIAGDHVKKAVLELGGSDPFIVLPSADVTAAAATAVRARINNNGQSCIAGKRFIVHTDVYDEFAAEFTRLMAALRVGDPLIPRPRSVRSPPSRGATISSNSSRTHAQGAPRS